MVKNFPIPRYLYLISDFDKSKFINKKTSKLLLATNNGGKLKEFRFLLTKLP